MDSRATRHVCNDQTIFKTYEPSDSMLYLGNHSIAQVKGKGKIDLVFTSGNTLTLKNVLHVLDVCKNLVSRSLLNKFGFKLVFESNKFILSKGGKFVDKGYHTDGMFKLNIKDVVNSSVNDVNMTEISDANDASAGIVTNNNAINNMHTSSYNFDSSLLWQARLGHVYFKRMRNMANANIIPKLDFKNDKCQTCMHTKITRLPFPTLQRSSKILELVHSDVCDLHATPTIGGKKYFATFIDDYSRYCCVYLLHSKDEVLEKFKIYKNEVELKCDTRIKCLRTDRGGEYYDPGYFQSRGFVHQVTPPYTPQQNGYWGEALLTACYILNRVPSKMSIKTPYELWNQKTPKLYYFRIWGCRAIVRLPESKKRKLGDKGIECIFLGYVQNSKAYRFIVVEPNDQISVNTITESRDARFNKNRLTPGSKAIKSKWIFKRKLRVDGSIEKFKARLVSKGFTQREGLDYFDTYALVAWTTTIRILIALAFINKFIIYQIYVKTAFLNSELEEEVYMEQPEDDMLIFGTDLEQVQMTKELLSKNFDMKDLGEADVILGIKILRKENRLMLTQSHYIEKILKRFDSFNCFPVSTSFEVGSELTYNTSIILAQNKYAKVIGSLMYAMTCTRPNIAYVVGRLSRHTSTPSKEHWDAVNRVFKYLKKTINYGLEYSGDPSLLEAEFVALASCCKEAEWLRDLLINIPLWPKPMPPIFVHCDSQSTLSRAYNQVYNEKTRQFEKVTVRSVDKAPTEGYGEAIVILEILAENFEIKTNLLQLVQTYKFPGFERDNPHTHISNFMRISVTLKYRDVSNDAIKLMLFPYSLEGAARIWYAKEPPNSILTWDDLVNKFFNQFFPPSKTTHLKNEISRFTQRFEETFGEAWKRFKEMLRACPHHGFSELTQIDTFYNGLNEQDQDSLNAAAGENLLSKTTREALKKIKKNQKFVIQEANQMFLG
nr:hypothetical protein [Tanacetum cinerariifolium]